MTNSTAITTDLTLLSLYSATPEQIIESRRRTCVQWGKGMSTEEYLARDAFTDKYENAANGKLTTWVLAPREDPRTLNFVSSCETFRREGLVWYQSSNSSARSESGVTPEKVTCYGIASVFTPPFLRGNGYAQHMMRLLHWVIADDHQLPSQFPVEWGLPPVRVKHAGDGRFSALWSDIGQHFYDRCGPTLDAEGWVVSGSISTIWSVRRDSQLSAAEPTDWTWLDEKGVLRLWDEDSDHIARTLNPSEDHQVSFTFLPNKGVAAFQHRRPIHFLANLTPQIQYWGIMAKSDSPGTASRTFATWTFEVRPPGAKTLIITRLSCEPDDFERLMAMIMVVANKHGMEQIEVYNLPIILRPIATIFYGKTFQRDEHMPAYKWYGAEDSTQVAWLLNESIYLSKNTRDLKPLAYDSLHNEVMKIPEFELTAILPITRESLGNLVEFLTPLLERPQLREVILLCPQAVAFQARSILKELVSFSLDRPDISLSSPAGVFNGHANVIKAASQVSTGWVLLMDEEGLSMLPDESRDALIRPPASSIPYGPRGICLSPYNISEICNLKSNEVPRPALYLLPPFIMPAHLATVLSGQYDHINSWALLGKHVAAFHGSGSGGLVFGMSSAASGIAKPTTTPVFNRGHNTSTQKDESGPGVGQEAAAHLPNSGSFIVLLPTLEDFHSFSALLCRLLRHGNDVHVCIYDEHKAQVLDGTFKHYASRQCNLTYVLLASPMAPWHNDLEDWIKSISPVDVVIACLQDKALFSVLDNLTTGAHKEAVTVRISREDLPHSEWMGSLTLTEWQNWNVPHLEISIITKNRPKSLARLVTSISKGLFFGDTVNLRINLEQSSDMETMKVVENISWTRGAIFVHHRIIHGGLLPAVVESWYPHLNDTYGLLLEDDVELSPLFYAWIKMSLLRYRYCGMRNKHPHMFGISLYQQKNIELSPDGRHPFDARALFSNSGLPSMHTPYLSPIPCSWGAIYFPEHWREFHAYLSIRLSEIAMKVDKIIVPDVRSNKWTKSWKKYFIEMAYLRGYVMLYPNYPDFFSLSTNHLEVGSHVKVRTKEKQNLFIVPLMQLPVPQRPTIGLLDLPDNTLPPWHELPVLNLTGALTTLEALIAAGNLRRKELTGRVSKPVLFDATDLICAQEAVIKG